jgi:multisubunit Na+/H+ antiporter MnhC subunit
MERREFQLSLTAMLGLVACIGLNIWLFRLSTLLGIIGLNISKHVIIAYLCQILGVNRQRDPATPNTPATRSPGIPVQ